MTILDFTAKLVDVLSMRLTESQRQEILRTKTEVFGTDASVFLFGSRTDDTAKGGDIDLLITTGLDMDTARKKKIRFLTTLKRRIGERRIDVVIRTPDTCEGSIHRIAIAEGVPIV